MEDFRGLWVEPWGTADCVVPPWCLQPLGEDTLSAWKLDGDPLSALFVLIRLMNPPENPWVHVCNREARQSGISQT